MTSAFDIRRTDAGDMPAICDLLAEAFPDEGLRPLVQRLLAAGAPTLSLCAVQSGELIGHIVFTRASVDGDETPIALLGPLCVSADRRRQGVGGGLIRAGLNALAEEQGDGLVLVLGDPAYYSRFGFTLESAVTPPYPLPEAWREAWRSRPFTDVAPPPSGRLVVPAPWRDPALWSAD